MWHKFGTGQYQSIPIRRKNTDWYKIKQNHPVQFTRASSHWSTNISHKNADGSVLVLVGKCWQRFWGTVQPYICMVQMTYTINFAAVGGTQFVQSSSSGNLGTAPRIGLGKPISPKALPSLGKRGLNIGAFLRPVPAPEIEYLKPCFYNLLLHAIQWFWVWFQPHDLNNAFRILVPKAMSPHSFLIQL